MVVKTAIKLMINKRRNRDPNTIAEIVKLEAESIKSPSRGPRSKPRPIVVTDTAAFAYTSRS